MIEAIVIGRVGVDLTPATPRTTLAAADGFVRAVGGFAGNIGTGLARLGIRTAVVSAVGDDGHGDHVRSFLAGEGIDVGPIVTMPGSRTQVAFFEVWPPDRFPVTFYRPWPAAETRLTFDDMPAELLATAPLAIVSATLLAEEPARSTTLRILEERRATRGRRAASTTILDLDWRPSLWVDPGEAPGLTAQAAELCDVLIGSDDEFAATGLVPVIAPGGGPTTIVLKHGPAGVSLIDETGRRHLPGIAVEVLCGIGAGDALTAAFAAGLVRGIPALEAVERGNVAGAIVASRLMCSTAMPTPAEIDALLVRSATRMIHPAKLPMTRDVASLHVHPDAAGAVATDPERSGWRYLSFRAFGLGEGESVTLEHPEQEAAIVAISGGGVELAFDRAPGLALAGRPSVFEGMPWSAYVPAGTVTRVVGRPCRAAAPWSRSPRRPRAGGPVSRRSRSWSARPTSRSRSAAPGTRRGRSTTS